MESKVLVAQWSAHASSKGKDDWFESIRAPPSLLSSVVERNTLDIVVVGSIPTGGTFLVPGSKIMDAIKQRCPSGQRRASVRRFCGVSKLMVSCGDGHQEILKIFILQTITLRGFESHTLHKLL